MIKTLLKAQIGQMLFGLTGNRAARKKRKNGKPSSGGTVRVVLFSLLYAYVAIVFIAMFFGVSFILAEMMLTEGARDIAGYTAIGALTAFVLCFVGSVFICEKQLYEAPDNARLLAMPIGASVILACRMLSLYLYNLAFAAIVLIPSYLVLFGYCGVSAGAVIAMIAAVLLIPLSALALTAMIGALVAFVSSRLPFKNLVTTVIFLAAFLGYMYFYMNLDTFLSSFATVGGQIAAALPPLSALGRLCSGELLWGIVFLLWCVVPFGAVYAVLSASFFSIATANRGARRVKYRARAMKRNSAFSALVKKELGRFFSMPMYILNCGMGSVFQIGLAVLLIVKRTDIDSALAVLGAELDFLPIGDTATIVTVALIAISALCCAFNYISAPSISLERDRIWQLKVMPVKARDVLSAKLACHVIVGFPTTLAFAVIATVLFSLDALCAAALILVPTLVSISVAAWGLCCNLWLPRLDHPSDVYAIKQSGATFLAVFCGMLIYFVPMLVCAGVGIALGSVALGAVLIGAFALLTAVAFCCYIYLGGTRKFENKIGM